MNFESTGIGSTGAADVSVGSQLVALAGKVYEKAVAQLNTVALNFGIVRVGDVVTARDVSVRNTTAVAGLNDTLAAAVSSSGPFQASGSVSGLAAPLPATRPAASASVSTPTALVYSALAPRWLSAARTRR